ncbi:MAG TPA: flagellar hook assembly protein FlgD [Steroidobacter sp.]|nr:flagellar hook assembly protein FlgD [Steroidobacteraceae bacterium]HLS82551.1 flagellar hook assembly protein FlgD [Steroidobacter sp.]
MSANTDPIASYAAQAQSGVSSAQANKSAESLGINDFLTLMTAQLRNQDPMKPLDGTEFVAQLAQFGAVSGIQQMQTSMETLAASLRSTQALNGATLVGRQILAPTSEFRHVEGAAASGEVEAPAGATEVEIRISDASGELVRRVTAPVVNGAANFVWDGLGDGGVVAPSGEYSIEALARVGSGAAESLEVLMSARVHSVSIDPSGASLTLNTALGALAMADVRRVM